MQKPQKCQPVPNTYELHLHVVYHVHYMLLLADFRFLVRVFQNIRAFAIRQQLLNVCASYFQNLNFSRLVYRSDRVYDSSPIQYSKPDIDAYKKHNVARQQRIYI